MDKFNFIKDDVQIDVEAVIGALQVALSADRSKEDYYAVRGTLSDLEPGSLTPLSQQEKRYINTSRLENVVGYLIYRWKFKNYPLMQIVPPFPLHLLIEPTSVCNLRCPSCFQSDKSFSNDKKFQGRMEWNLFKRLIDEAVAGGTKALTLASRGEPTLNPLFGDMLWYCADKFFDLKINTNAILLDDELMHRIYRSNVGIVVFSVDAYNSEGYFAARDSKKFDIVVENIRRMGKIRDLYYPDSKTVLRAHAVCGERFNKDKFSDFWKDLVDEVTCNEVEARCDTYNNHKNNNDEACKMLYERMYIWYDGTCNPCDMDYKSALSVGNVVDNTISEIWNGRAYNQIRRVHANGTRNALIPCDRCTY